MFSRTFKGEEYGTWPEREQVKYLCQDTNIHPFVQGRTMFQSSVKLQNVLLVYPRDGDKALKLQSISELEC
jgi:hypothetical protein